MDEEFHLEKDTENGATVLRFIGNLDRNSIGVFSESLVQEVTGGKVIIDMGGLTFLGSLGIGNLMGFARKVEASGGQCQFRNCSPFVVKALKMVGLEDKII